MHKCISRHFSLLLICLLLLSLCLPLLVAHHSCDHECCAICHAVEVSIRLLGMLMPAAAMLSLNRAAVRAFVRTRAEGRLFDTPVARKVKLSD